MIIDKTLGSDKGLFNMFSNVTRDIVFIFIAVLTLVFYTSPTYGQLADTPWPSFGNNIRNTGLSDYKGTQTDSLKWRFETEDRVDSSPAIGADGTIYVGSHDGYLYAINPEGTKEWRFNTDNKIYSSPAIGADGTIYVGSLDSHLYAINPDGTKQWRFKTESSVASGPAIGSDGTIYVGSYDNYIYAIGKNE